MEDLNSAIIQKITGHLVVRDWLNFHAVCQAFDKSRSEKQLFVLCMSFKQITSIYAQLDYVIRRNDFHLLYWFLRKNRHQIRTPYYTSLIASYHRGNPRMSDALLEFDTLAREKARQQVSLLADCEIHEFYNKLCQRKDYRLPVCRELATRLRIRWETHFLDIDILDAIARIYKW